MTALLPNKGVFIAALGYFLHQTSMLFSWYYREFRCRIRVCRVTCILSEPERVEILGRELYKDGDR